jgi:hypothetical protein
LHSSPPNIIQPVPFPPSAQQVQIGSEEWDNRAKVDCCYRSRESRWGKYYGGQLQAALLYFDLAFRQPSDCLFEYAEIHLTFTSTSASTTSGQATTPLLSNSTVEVNSWYGPKHLKRELGHDTGSRTTQIQPELSLNVAGQGLSVGGMGPSTTRALDVARRWEL